MKINIIGGGIVGQFIAYFLSKTDHDISIIDDNPKMPPASVGNCGLVSPSHLMPLNSWTNIWATLKCIGKKDAPIAFTPQFDTTFIQWMLSFISHCRNRAIQQIIPARHQLLQLSSALYKEFFEKETTTCEWNDGGVYYVCNTRKGLSTLTHEVNLLNKYHLPASLLSSKELLHIFPSLRKDIVLGGAVYETDGWLNPLQLLSDVKAMNQKKGVKFVNSRVIDFQIEKRKIQSVLCKDQSFTADKFILAAGAQSILLSKKLKVNIPIIPGKGYNLTSNTHIQGQPKAPVYMLEKKVVATPWKNALRLGSTMEFSGFNLDLNPHRLDALYKAMNTYFDIVLDKSNFTSWSGWRPMTPNELPLIGYSSQYSNLIYATGHGMLGLSMAPATGYLVQQIVADNYPDIMFLLKNDKY